MVTATRMIVSRCMQRIRFVTLACFSLWHPSVRAQHIVQVRTTSSIRPDDSAPSPSHRVGGTLVDDLGEPLGEQPVRILAGPRAVRRLETMTDEAGHFDLSAPPHGISDDDARVRFDGNAHIDATEWSLTTPSAQMRCDMTVSADGRVDLDEEGFTLALRLLPADAPATDIAVFDERGHELARHRATGGLPSQITISNAQLAPAGVGKLTVNEVESDGSPGTTIGSQPIVRFRSTTISASFDSRRGRTAVRGVVSDRSGRGLANQTVVVLAANGAPIAAGTTGDAGAFAVALSHGAIASGSAVTVKHESNAPWWVGGTSPQLVIPQPNPSYPPWWSLAGLAAAAAFSWTLPRLVRRMTDASTPGQSIQRTNLPATRTRVGKKYWVRARVVNATTHAGISGAVVQVRPSEATPAAVIATAANGWFELPALPGGEFRLDISLEGYESRSIPLNIPHDGRWHDATILLSSLRSVALRNYERAFHLTVQPQIPQHLTPRERVAFLSGSTRKESTDGRVLQLTRAFECAYYGRRIPTTKQLMEIRMLADAVAAAEDPGFADSFDAPSGASL